MRIKLPKLHNQILIALFLGAVFGSLLKVNVHRLEVKYKSGGAVITSAVDNWKTLSFIVEGEMPDTLSFRENQQLEIISAFAKLKKAEKNFSVEIDRYFDPGKNITVEKTAFSSVLSVGKEKTFAQKIKWIGDIFIRLLSMIAIPLVLASLIVGAASLEDVKKFARIGGKTLAFYLSTTAFAIIIGLVAANIIQPGKAMNPDTKERLLSVYQGDAASKIDSQFEFDLSKEIVDIVPKNPFAALAGGEMLQIVFFAVLLGIILTMIKKEKAQPVINFFDGLSEVMIKLVDVVMLIAPVGVFALISATVAEFGFDILKTLLWYMVTVLIGLLLHTFGVYSLLIKIFTRLKAGDFLKGMRRVQTIAFSTSSSAATLPVNIETCQENFGVSKGITSFVLPLGATINMDGTALYQGVAAVFIAQVFGMELNLVQQLTIVLTAVLASIGTAPVPGVGIIMLVIILKSVGIPEEGIALILGVDRILDMCRTVTNVTGDAMVACIVASGEKEDVRYIAG